MGVIVSIIVLRSDLKFLEDRFGNTANAKLNYFYSALATEANVIGTSE